MLNNVKQCYTMLKHYDSIGYINWATKVRTCLYRNGFGYVWEQQSVDNQALFISSFMQRLKDQYMQQWNEICNTQSKLESYAMFKPTFSYERYLDVLDVKKFRYSLVAFRSSSHHLMIETGRHIGIARDIRRCFNCHDTIESEYHFLLVCPLYNHLREVNIPRKFYHNPTLNKFNVLMASRNDGVIKGLATFIYYGMKLRADLMVS